jgi:hypothetical protein
VDCDAGKLSEAGSSKCQPCEAGTFSNVTGADCQHCDAGQYRQSKEKDGNATDPTTCVDCPTGYSSSDGSTKCQSCGAGRYGVGCEVCGQGQYRNGSDPIVTSCRNCSTGYYNDDVGQGSCLPCIPVSVLLQIFLLRSTITTILTLFSLFSFLFSFFFFYSSWVFFRANSTTPLVPLNANPAKQILLPLTKIDKFHATNALPAVPPKRAAPNVRIAHRENLKMWSTTKKFAATAPLALHKVKRTKKIVRNVFKEKKHQHAEVVFVQLAIWVNSI